MLASSLEKEHAMPAYAVGHLHDVTIGPAIVDYLRRIDATLEPFGGRFLLHGEPVEVLEGTWSGDLVVIEFPDRGSARAWYASPAYRQILPQRSENASSVVFLTDGVPADHKATDILSALPTMDQPLG
jgi:uncharacterized protein (DUF1330 family)